MKSHKMFLQIIFLLGLIAAFLLVRSYENPKIQMTAGQLENQGVDTLERLKRLEPDIPVDIKESPFLNPPFPSAVSPASEIFEKGQELPLEIAYSNQEWKRTAYKSYWHSTVSSGRWSYVPNRIHYAMHRIFTTYNTASAYYDFLHDLGIDEESKSFNFTAEKPFEKITAVVMQTEIKKVLTYGNQVLLVAKPQRSGLQVVTVPVDKIKPTNPDDYILFQLVTSEGDEIDYSLISYAQWK